MNAVFEITVLSLEMVRSEVHAFGPNHSSEVLHGFTGASYFSIRY